MATDKEISVDGRAVLLRKQAAARARISPETWHAYVSRRMPKGNPAPQPDGHIDDRTPFWYPETVDAWDRLRPRASRNVDTSDAL